MEDTPTPCKHFLFLYVFLYSKAFFNLVWLYFRTDGYIVCEEDEEILRAAWVEEQEIQKKKEKEVCLCVC